MNEETKCCERELNYKMPFESTLVGKGTISTYEKQVNIDEGIASDNHFFMLFDLNICCPFMST